MALRCRIKNEKVVMIIKFGKLISILLKLFQKIEEEERFQNLFFKASQYYPTFKTRY